MVGKVGGSRACAGHYGLIQLCTVFTGGFRGSFKGIYKGVLGVGWWLSQFWSLDTCFRGLFNWAFKQPGRNKPTEAPTANSKYMLRNWRGLSESFQSARAGHPSSCRYFAHSALVLGILSLKRTSSMSVSSAGGPCSKTARGGKLKESNESNDRTRLKSTYRASQEEQADSVPGRVQCASRPGSVVVPCTVCMILGSAGANAN